jgi:prepilin signal peptidase PulO-like enzyme (type II secretory pathway)
MENRIIIAIGLSVLGLIIGSFLGASVWRLRARQLRLDAKNSEKIEASDKHEVAKLQHKSIKSDRSVCLHCGHVLKWYDLIPLLSWVLLKAKCRYCHKPIGWFEPAIELGLAAFFVASYLFWPATLVSTLDITQFVIWLLAGVGLAVLFVYDAKWFLLPNVIIFPLIGLGAVNAVIVVARHQFEPSVIVSILVSCLVLSGFYFAIYVLSRRQWVGFGDVKLGLVLALLLADWQLAISAFFLANLIGTLIFLPPMLIGKIKRQTHIPFGPLLIAGWVLAGLFGASILNWYTAFTLGV